MKNFFVKRPYLLFLGPGFILYTVFVIYPIFAAGQLSLFKWNGIGPKTFVGLQNYVTLFSSSDLMSQMMNALKNSLTIFALTAIIQIPLQIIMAYMVYTKTRGQKYFQVAIFSPQFISTPVIIFLFTLIFDGNIGVFNKFLELIGFGQYARSWMGVPSFGIYIVWLMIMWAGIGVGMLYFIGAMKMVGTDSLESACLEGCGFWRRLIYIIIPQIKMTILNLVLISYIFSMTIFDFSYILGGTSGGINGSVDVMSLFFYRMAFGDTNPLGGNVSSNSVGMGTTVACVLFFMIFIVAMIQLFIVYRKGDDNE